MSTPVIFLYSFRMYETKLKELETDIAKKTQSLTDLKQLVRQATEREQKIKKYTEGLEQQASNVIFIYMMKSCIISQAIPSYCPMQIKMNSRLILTPGGPSK